MKWSRLAVIVPMVRTLRSALLVLTGFACFVIAAFLAHRIAGFAVAGVSLLLIEFLTRPEDDKPPAGAS